MNSRWLSGLALFLSIACAVALATGAGAAGCGGTIDVWSCLLAGRWSHRQLQRGGDPSTLPAGCTCALSGPPGHTYPQGDCAWLDAGAEGGPIPANALAAASALRIAPEFWSAPGLFLIGPPGQDAGCPSQVRPRLYTTDRLDVRASRVMPAVHVHARRAGLRPRPRASPRAPLPVRTVGVRWRRSVGARTGTGAARLPELRPRDPVDPRWPARHAGGRVHARRRRRADCPKTCFRSTAARPSPGKICREQWSLSALGCVGTTTGTCADLGGKTCIPQAAGFQVCVAQQVTWTVAAPKAPFSEMHVFYANVDDTRGCSPCSCAPTPGSCFGRASRRTPAARAPLAN